jgi:hypothetical protein
MGMRGEALGFFALFAITQGWLSNSRLSPFLGKQKVTHATKGEIFG